MIFFSVSFPTVNSKDVLIAATRSLSPAKTFFQLEGSTCENIVVDGGGVSKAESASTVAVVVQSQTFVRAKRFLFTPSPYGDSAWKEFIVECLNVQPKFYKHTMLAVVYYLVIKFFQLGITETINTFPAPEFFK